MADIGALSGGGAGGITGQLDVQWIVEQIISAKQQPIRELETYEIFYEAKKEAFQELNTRVSAVESALYTLNNNGFASKTATPGTGDGSLLTGTAGNSTGLIVTVSTLSVGPGGEDKGEVYFTRGVGETLRERMYERSFPYTGLIAKNINALENQLDNISDKIAEINRNLQAEAETLIAQFTLANEALAQMTYLQSTLSNNFMK